MTRDLRLIALSLLIWGVGEGMFIYFQPVYLHELGADPVQIGGILGLAALGMLVSHIPAGALADHVGRKSPMVARDPGLVPGMMAARAAVCRRVGPYSITVFASPCRLHHLRAAPGHRRARPSPPVSPVRSRPGDGGQLTAYGLRSVYVVSTGIFVSTLMSPIRPQPIDPAHDGHRYRALLGNRRLGGFLGLVLLVNFAMYLPWPLTPNFLQEVHAVSVSQIGLLGAFTGLGVVLFNLALGHLPAKRGLLIGQALVAGAALALWRGQGFGWYAAGYFLFAGYRTARSLIAATIHGLVSPAELGLAFGANETVAAAGLMAAAPIAGLLFARQAALPFPVGVGLILLGLLLSAAFAPKTHAEIEPEPPSERGVVGGI
jgi:MFS family permease